MLKRLGLGVLGFHIRATLGLFWDSGKEHGNYYLGVLVYG